MDPADDGMYTCGENDMLVVIFLKCVCVLCAESRNLARIRHFIQLLTGGQ